MERPATPQTVIQTVEVEKVVTVEVEKQVEVEKIVTVEVEKQVEVEKVVTVEVMVTQEADAGGEAEAAAPEDNPYRPNDLFDAVEDLKAATEGKSAPAGAKFAFLTNNMSPFWTAAQIGVARVFIGTECADRVPGANSF